MDERASEAISIVVARTDLFLPMCECVSFTRYIRDSSIPKIHKHNGVGNGFSGMVGNACINTTPECMQTHEQCRMFGIVCS